MANFCHIERLIRHNYFVDSAPVPMFAMSFDAIAIVWRVAVLNVAVLERPLCVLSVNDKGVVLNDTLSVFEYVALVTLRSLRCESRG